MRHALGTCIVWESMVMIVVGVIGCGALMFLYRPDTGAPFNIFAGLIMGRWVLQTPLVWKFFGLAVLGLLGFGCGSALVKPSSSK